MAVLGTLVPQIRYRCFALDFGYVHLAFEGNHNPKDLQDSYRFLSSLFVFLLNTIQMYRGNQPFENQKRRKVRVSKMFFVDEF